MSKKRGIAKRINKKNSIYKIKNEEGLWLSIIGVNPRIHWNPLRGLADTFGMLRIEGLKERFPELDFDNLELVEVDDNEILNDKERYLIARS